MSINKVHISGNLTRDAELRATSSGTSILTFGVAVNERRRNQSGEWEDYANFIDCTMFGRRADALAKYLTKGAKVCVEGRLHYSSWEDRNGGGRRSKLDVSVDEIEFMSSRNQSVESTVSNTFNDAKVTEEPAGAYNDEDIPF